MSADIPEGWFNQNELFFPRTSLAVCSHTVDSRTNCCRHIHYSAVDFWERTMGVSISVFNVKSDFNDWSMSLLNFYLENIIQRYEQDVDLLNCDPVDFLSVLRSIGGMNSVRIYVTLLRRWFAYRIEDFLKYFNSCVQSRAERLENLLEEKFPFLEVFLFVVDLGRDLETSDIPERTSCLAMEIIRKTAEPRKKFRKIEICPKHNKRIPKFVD